MRLVVAGFFSEDEIVGPSADSVKTLPRFGNLIPDYRCRVNCDGLLLIYDFWIVLVLNSDSIYDLFILRV
jgi:hypothetical protein